MSFWAKDAHGCDSRNWHGGTDEDGRSFTFRKGADVQHPMHSVSEVNIGVAGRTKHYGASGRRTAMGVGAGIIDAAIGFGFDDTGDAVLANEVHSKQGDGAEANVLLERLAQSVGNHTIRWWHETRLPGGEKKINNPLR